MNLVCTDAFLVAHGRKKIFDSPLYNFPIKAA